MGNRSSSTSKLKQNPDGNRTAANNGMRSPRNNDVSHTQTKANEVADVQPSLNLKIHRSVSEIDQTDRADIRPDFRLLRRSFTVGRRRATAADGEHHGRQQNTSSNGWATITVPHGAGRTGSSVSTAAVVSEDNDRVVLRNRNGVPTKPKRRPTSDFPSVKTRSIHSARPSSSLCLTEDDPIEFPDCTTIRCRTAAFQRRFVEHFMTLYSCLPVSVQVSALSVAVRRHSSGPASHVEPSSLSYSTDMFVSLHQYLAAAASCVDVPLQLPASEYALTVYPDHFDLVRRARVDGCADPAGLARQIVADVAGEAATELARAFEYQIVLLGDDEGLSARLGAKRGAERAVDYLKTTSRHVDVNSLIRGVVEGPPAAAPQTVSAIIGRHHELHWNLDDMFQRPGLRRERLLVAGEVDALGGYGTPWRFYASTSGTDAILYGYRSQLLERDFHSEWLRGGRQKSYRLNIDEEAAYDVEVPWRSDDFHRTYRPYRRLVGSAVMASYASRSVEDKSTISLSQFVQRLHGDAFCRDEVESVFRPLTPDFRRESFSAVVLRNSSNDSGTNPASTLLTSRGICCEASVPSSNSMPESHASTGDTPLLSDSKHIQELFISTQSSTSDKSLSVCDGTLRSQFPVGSNRPLTLHAFCTDALIHGTNSTTGACNGNMSEVNQSRDVTAAEQQLSAKRRPPPPVVKPKPSLELRRRLSVTGPATTSGGSQSMTSLPVNQRQSSVPVDRSDSTADVTVRFPTLDELFGRELAAMGLASGSTDNQNS